MIRRLSITALALVGAATVFLQAQQNVTLHMRNGERLQATLVDLKAAGFEVRIGDNDRMIAKDQVAMVDFGTGVKVPASAFNGMTPLDHLVVLKSGDTFLAEWLDVGGTSPLRLTFRTGNGERDLTSDNVARIYLARPATVEGRPTEDQGGAQPDGSVNVLATQPWTDTGRTVRTGQMLRFDVSGQIRVGTGDEGLITADGVRSAGGRGVLRVLPVREMPLGGLIGRVGSGQPFAIGTAPQAIRMPANGRLWLGINDLDFDGHSGAFRVVIR